jgi:hypothetical protein
MATGVFGLVKQFENQDIAARRFLANGAPVLPQSEFLAGTSFYVDSGLSAAGDGRSPAGALATLDAAFALCTANKGDKIIVMPNHAETITGAGGITADVAGVTVIGLGRGNQRPRFLMDAGTAVTFVISAADVTVHNLVFAAGHADIVTCFDITAAYATISACEFVNNVVDENFLTEIKATSTTDNNADGLTVIGCRAMTIDASGVEFLELNADVNGLVFNDNFISKDAATAAAGIFCATGKDLRDCQVLRNILIVGNTAGDLLIDNDTAVNSGVVAYNLVGHHDVVGAIVVDCDGVRQFENYSNASDTASGVILPVIDVDGS